MNQKKQQKWIPAFGLVAKPCCEVIEIAMAPLVASQ
jgi:hypothetical protein